MRRRLHAKSSSRILSLPLWGSRLSTLIFFVLALALFAVSAVRPGNLQGLRTGVADMLAPAMALVNTPVQKAAAYVRMVSGLAELQEANARLQEENTRLREWYQTALVLKSENESLQKLLNITLAPQHKYTTAQVIADPGSTYVRTLLLLSGKKQGVDKGQAVLSGEGVIGRVLEAGERSARVLLITDINSRIPVIIDGKAYHAILAGGNDNLPHLEHLPAGSVPEEGARVITSGFGGIFPYGLPVGEVVKRKDGNWAVRPFADPGRASFVRVVSVDSDPNLLEGLP